MKKRFNFKDSKIANWLYLKRIYFFAFFIPAALMYAVYAAFGFYPFGDNSVLVLDLNGQYVYYYEAMRQAFWGHASMFYSWSRNLGGEMVGIFAYYLASPFSLIVMLLPDSFILESILIMQLCKLGAMGVAFSFYLKNSKRIGDYTALLFSVLYSMMAYAVVQLMDPMWLDGLVYLPLIIYGVEKLVDEGKFLRLIIPLALMFLANFYIGWMVAFFTVIYFVYYFFFAKKEEGFTVKEGVICALRFGVSAVVSGMCAAVLLIPVYYSLKLGKLDFTHPDYSLRAQFTIIDFFTKLLPESYDTVRNEGLPFVYCGVLTLFMVPLYFLNKNIETRKKIGGGVLLSAIFLSMYMSTIDLAWHGFQVPNWLPYRYSFVFSFVMLVLAAEAFERIEGVSLKNIAAVFGILLVYVIYADSKDYKHLSTEKAIWFSLACIIGFGLLLCYYKKNSSIKNMPLVMLVLVIGELFGSSLQTLYDIDDDVVYSKHSSYGNYIAKSRDVIDKLKELDSGFYRTEKTFYRTVNDPLAIGMKGVSHSSSTLNAGPIKLLYNLGFSSGGHYIKYKGDTLVTDALFGIKYIMTKDKKVYYDNSVLVDDDITVYQNPNALSVGYMVGNGVKDLTIENGNPFVNQNKLLSAMLSEEYVEYFKQITDVQVKTNNLSESISGMDTRYAKTNSGQDASIEFQMQAPADALVYMFLPSTYYVGHELSIWVNQQYLDPYYETENYCIKTLGRFSSGDDISVVASLNKDDVYIKDHWFYYLDQDLFDAAIANLKQNQLNVTDYSDTYIKGTVKAEDGQMLLTTIPYEPGWTVKVDGQKVDYVKAAGALIGIELSPGEHTIEMSFFPYGLLSGIIVSAAGILLVIVIAIYERRTRKVLLYRLYD